MAATKPAVYLFSQHYIWTLTHHLRHSYEPWLKKVHGTDGISEDQSVATLTSLTTN